MKRGFFLQQSAHLRRTDELDASRPDELDTIAILLVKAHGDLSVHGRLSALVAGEPDAF